MTLTYSISAKEIPEQYVELLTLSKFDTFF